MIVKAKSKKLPARWQCDIGHILKCIIPYRLRWTWLAGNLESVKAPFGYDKINLYIVTNSYQEAWS